LIAPCGMNCGVCYAHLRPRNKCPGCRAANHGKPKTRTKCPIKTCSIRRRNKADFCVGCDRLPCDRLQRLDRRYREKYSMSMIENLQKIAAEGVRSLIEEEGAKWVCAECGATLCVHKGYCLVCERPWR